MPNELGAAKCTASPYSVNPIFFNFNDFQENVDISAVPAVCIVSLERLLVTIPSASLLLPFHRLFCP
jgi:hypothetical protein